MFLTDEMLYNYQLVQGHLYNKIRRLQVIYDSDWILDIEYIDSDKKVRVEYMSIDNQIKHMFIEISKLRY